MGGGFPCKTFYFYITVVTASLFPCWGFGFGFWFPAQHISIAQFLGSWHILNVRCLVQFLSISRLFKVPLRCLFWAVILVCEICDFLSFFQHGWMLFPVVRVEVSGRGICLFAT